MLIGFTARALVVMLNINTAFAVTYEHLHLSENKYIRSTDAMFTWHENGSASLTFVRCW
jgi:hypothetical protein